MGEIKSSEFSVTCNASAESSRVTHHPIQGQEYDAGNYRLVFGKDELDPVVDTQYQLPVWVYERGVPTSSPSGELMLTCKPVGSFSDHREKLPLAVLDNGSKLADLTIESFPLHSSDLFYFQLIPPPGAKKEQVPGFPSLNPARDDMDIVDFDLDQSDDNPSLQVQLKESKIVYPMVVRDVSIDEGKPAPCWKHSLPILNRTAPVLNSVDVPVRLSDFSRWCAFKRTMRRLWPEDYDTIERVTISYEPVGGWPRKFTYLLRIRYQPTGSELAIATLVGLITGFGLRFGIERLWKDGSRHVSLQLLVAIGLVIFAEFLAYLGFHVHKPTTFFGIDLNPGLWAGCALIALLAAGGPVVRATLRKNPV